MNRYTVLTGRDACENLYWTIYDRVARITLHHKPAIKAEAWEIADSLNEGCEYCA